ncbi:MAG: hypothetical protein ABI672_03970 [Vicinamibacteria bacterium]
MNKAWAVALLDLKRMGRTMIVAAVVAGLLPTLVSGFGTGISGMLLFDTNALLGLLMVVVGVAAGLTFGGDFTAGRASFVFARPLSITTLFAGRLLAMIGLAVGTGGIFLLTRQIFGSPEQAGFFLMSHDRTLQLLLMSWSVALFLGLAVSPKRESAAQSHGPRSWVITSLRTMVTLAAFIYGFGYFADFAARTRSSTSLPVRWFFEGWIFACFVASVLGISMGRADFTALRRARSRTMAVALGLCCVIVFGARVYALNIRPTDVDKYYFVNGSRDGQSAYVFSYTDRRGRLTLGQQFALDISSGAARSLNNDPGQGPWQSADGKTIAWSEATPFFIRPLWRSLTGHSNLRAQTENGRIATVSLPRAMPNTFSASEGIFGPISRVVPANDGDLFAIHWETHVTFVSLTRGEISDGDLRRNTVGNAGSAFAPSGAYRVITIGERSGTSPRLNISDIDPASGKVTNLGDIDGTWARMDDRGERAMITSHMTGTGSDLSVVRVAAEGARLEETTLDVQGRTSTGMFLSDGRIATFNASEKVVHLFSAEGRPLMDIPVLAGDAKRLGSEMFPGILAVGLMNNGAPDVALYDTHSGAMVRRLSRVSPFPEFYSHSPAGTPGSRLLRGDDGKLYVLPSLTEQPKQIIAH